MVVTRKRSVERFMPLASIDRSRRSTCDRRESPSRFLPLPPPRLFFSSPSLLLPHSRPPNLSTLHLGIALAITPTPRPSPSRAFPSASSRWESLCDRPAAQRASLPPCRAPTYSGYSKVLRVLSRYSRWRGEHLGVGRGRRLELLQHSLGGAVVVARTRLLLLGELSHSKQNTHTRESRSTDTNKQTDRR